MSVLFVLIPMALLLGLLFLFGFLLAAKNGQMNDLETPAYRALIDDSESMKGKNDVCERQS